MARHQVSSASYRHILVETKHSSEAVIVGQLPGDVLVNLQNYRALSTTRLETREQPIEILTVLGNLGYHVVAMANTHDNRIVWTLTHDEKI